MCSLIVMLAAQSSWATCEPLTPIHAFWVPTTCSPSDEPTGRSTDSCAMRRRRTAGWGARSISEVLGSGHWRQEESDQKVQTRVHRRVGLAGDGRHVTDGLDQHGAGGSCPHLRSWGESVRSPPRGFYLSWCCRALGPRGAGFRPETHGLPSDTEQTRHRSTRNKGVRGFSSSSSGAQPCAVHLLLVTPPHGRVTHPSSERPEL